MLGLCGNYFSRYGFPGVGISRRDLLYIPPNTKYGAFKKRALTPAPPLTANSSMSYVAKIRPGHP